jgi:hypothetical protein
MPQTKSLLTMPRTNRSTHIRVPSNLRDRLRRLRDEMQLVYSDGRVEVPNDLVEQIPLWFVIQAALNEVEARRARSNWPPASQDPIRSSAQDPRGRRSFRGIISPGASAWRRSGRVSVGADAV